MNELTVQDSGLAFEDPDLLNALTAMDDVRLDDLEFGVMAFGTDGHIRRYNKFETAVTGLTQTYVLGKHVFTKIAQCMNNFMVSQRFEDAWASGQPLDVSMDYVLTWRMKPTKVKLRLLWAKHSELAYIVLSPRSPLDN